ncbi:MAG: glycosyltransferase family 9 protein [Alphaproteobacteria bacterium]|nr:glycosyltransferase family 9 protein [Alphaproteobacteria bacterium]
MRILFISSSRLGDAILSTGLLHHLVERYPEARFTVACGPVAASLFEAVPRLERLIYMRKGPLMAHWRALLAATITKRWFMVVDVRGSATVYVLPTTRRHVYARRDRDAHRVEDMRHILDLAEPAAPRIWLGPAHQAFADQALGVGKGAQAHAPLLVLGPTANWDAKIWPSERFAALAQALTASHGVLAGARVAVVGGPGERDMAAPLLDAIPAERLVDLMEAAVLDTAAVIARASLYVGNDSGLMHLAAASGAPTLGLFGPTRDENYAPWGPHCAVVRTQATFDELRADPNYCPRPDAGLMDGLAVETVVGAAETLLARIEAQE